jgi:small-conductance mechanosensitive channel
MKFIALFLFSFLFFFKSAQAQPQNTPETHGQTNCQALTVAGFEIVCLKHGIGPFSLQERMAAIQKRLDRLSKDKTFDPDKIEVADHGASSEIMADDTVIASLRDEDVSSKIAPNRQEMAKVVASRMRKAIKADRVLKSPTEIFWGVGYTLLATLGLILVLSLLGRLFPRFYSLIQQNEGRYIRSIKIKTFEILNSARIVAVLLWLAKALRVLITVMIFYIYIPLLLSFFPWTANWTPKLYGYIVDPIVKIFNVAVAFIPNLFFIIAISLVTRYLLKLVQFFFHEVEMGRLQMEGFFKEWAQPTYKLVRILIIAFALIMAFPYLPGSDSPAFQGVSVFLGILLSLGSSSAIANIVAGVVITYMRPFKVGDRVKIADTMGDVIEKNLLVTRIRSIKNVEVTIPNSMVLGSHIINYSSTAEQDGLVLNTTITIGYDVPWRKVHELLKEAAKRTEFINQERESFVLQTGLNDFYVAYELNAYTNVPNKMALTYSQLHQNIQDCFNEAGVEIMSPHYSTIRDGNETTIPSQYRAEGYEIPAFKVNNLKG